MADVEMRDQSQGRDAFPKHLIPNIHATIGHLHCQLQLRRQVSAPPFPTVDPFWDECSGVLVPMRASIAKGIDMLGCQIDSLDPIAKTQRIKQLKFVQWLLEEHAVETVTGWRDEAMRRLSAERVGLQNRMRVMVMGAGMARARRECGGHARDVARRLARRREMRLRSEQVTGSEREVQMEFAEWMEQVEGSRRRREGGRAVRESEMEVGIEDQGLELAMERLQM